MMVQAKRRGFYACNQQRSLYGDLIMGFTAIATTAAATLPKVLGAYGSYQQGKALDDIANRQETLANRQSAAMQSTAVANQQRAARNANAQSAHARADAAASNLAAEGSVTVRERDLATRLQDEITANANSALEQADNVRQQGALNAWQTRQEARKSRMQAFGQAASGIGSIFGNLQLN